MEVDSSPKRLRCAATDHARFYELELRLACSNLTAANVLFQLKASKGKILKMINTVADYVRKDSKCDSAWLSKRYTWKIPKKMPVEVELNGLSLAEQNIAVRKALHKEWQNNVVSRQELAKWYVQDWGGIARNNLETIKGYIALFEKQCIPGLDGIATWSKLLAVTDPSKYFIFDARVSASLNAIAYISKLKTSLWPFLPSRNRAISCFSKTMRKHSAERKRYPPEDVYGAYCGLILKVADKLKVKQPDRIEMVLFADAENLTARVLKCMHASAPTLRTDH